MIWKIELEVNGLQEKYVEAAGYAGPLELAAIMSAEDQVVQELQGDLRVLKRNLGHKVASISVPERSTQSQRSRITHLERVKLQEFDGKFESWPRFKQEWADLQNGQETTDAIQLRQLREKLPRQAQDMICGIGPENGGIKAAFARLDREYGDRDLNILTVQKRLDSFQPRAKENHVA